MTDEDGEDEEDAAGRERFLFDIARYQEEKLLCREGRLVYVYEREESEREISIILSLVRREL